MMSDYHKIQIIKDGTILSESEYRVLRCPYSKLDSRYGYMDDSGYFKCNNNYCEDAACSYYHTDDRDCITDKIDRGEWDEWEMDQFENDFCDLDWETDDNCAEWMSLYQMLKTNDCMITDRTHSHYEALLQSQPTDAKIGNCDTCDDCTQCDEIDGRNGFTPEGVPIPDWYYSGHNSADWEAWCNSYGPKAPATDKKTPLASDWIGSIHGR